VGSQSDRERLQEAGTLEDKLIILVSLLILAMVDDTNFVNIGLLEQEKT